jgi:diguanylate cyclase (GGDEF)-like protein
MTMRILPRRASLGRRLLFAIASMLLPIVAVAGLGILTFSTTATALEEFRAQTVGESLLIARVRELLSRVDDAGEAYVETADPVMGERFLELSTQIGEGFDRLESLNTYEERVLVKAARDRWDSAHADIEVVISGGTGLRGDRLDLFHDHVDGAASLLADAEGVNVSEVAVQIASLRGRERFQLFAAILTLIAGSILGGLLALRVYRSIAPPLRRLEEAASRFGSDILNYRIDASGDDELARVGSAFNSMADKLELSRQALHQRALHDPLTELPNRTLFLERTERAIARSKRRKTPVSVMYLDLDSFKAVNDTFGHQAGDEILVAFAERLKGALRAEDTAARLGGDEFGVLLEEDLVGASRTAQRLIGALAGTYAVTAGELPIGVSIGVATRRDAEELDELLHQADVAMYSAKATGKGGWRVFGPGEEPSNATLMGVDGSPNA